MYTVNKQGVYYIQQWIDSNQDKNPKVLNLWAGGIASQIDQLDVCEELNSNGRYGFELGMRDAQGHNLVIHLYNDHFTRVGEAS